MAGWDCEITWHIFKLSPSFIRFDILCKKTNSALRNSKMILLMVIPLINTVAMSGGYEKGKMR